MLVSAQDAYGIYFFKPDHGAYGWAGANESVSGHSALRAIESFDSGLVVILGGRFKGGDFGQLRQPLSERQAAVVAIGEAAPLVRDALAPTVPVMDAADMVAAVRTAFAAASPGNTVLLAPACSSFDMFKDYADRGRVFKQTVAKLEDEWNGTREQ